MISYEVSMLITIMPTVLYTSSANLSEIIYAQEDI